MDPFRLLPPAIRENAEAEEMVDRGLAATPAIAGALKDLDPRLELTFFGDRAVATDGIIPGRWHVVRRNDPPAPDTYMPITTPDGGYRWPDSGVVFELQRRDMWRQGYQRPVYRPEKKVDDEQLADEAAADLKAMIRLPGDGGLTKRKWGRG